MVAQLVEHSVDNGTVAGSIPAYAIWDDKRIGKRSVLKTDARKGLQVRVHASSANFAQAARMRPLVARTLLRKKHRDKSSKERR